jgi:hypothetical protein
MNEFSNDRDKAKLFCEIYRALTPKLFAAKIAQH